MPVIYCHVGSRAVFLSWCSIANGGQSVLTLSGNGKFLTAPGGAIA